MAEDKKRRPSEPTMATLLNEFEKTATAIITCPATNKIGHIHEISEELLSPDKALISITGSAISNGKTT